MRFIPLTRIRKLVAALTALVVVILLLITQLDEKPHREQCVKWGYDGNQFAAKNHCDEAVFVQFQRAGRSPIGSQVNPGEMFFTGLERSQMRVGRPCWDYWMFTACPVGYVSSVPFWAENCKAIISSEYSCVKKWRAGCQRREFVNF